MNVFIRFKLFQKAVIGICVLFSSLMVLVVIAANVRLSGFTGIDPAKIQHLRQRVPTTSVQPAEAAYPIPKDGP